MVLFALVDDIGAAILRIRLLAIAWRTRFLLAEAHGLDLRARSAQERHHLLHGIGTALAQSNVVLATSALVRVALYGHFPGAIRGEVLRVRRNERLVLVLDP